MNLPGGTVVAGKYEILGLLGRGGMGEVYRARHIHLGRAVALKLLRADAKLRADAVERFRREAKGASAIVSPHVTQVLDVEDDPHHGIAIVLELLEGESLLDLLKREGPLPLDRLGPIVDQLLVGLCDAHAAGIVHRDLKPSNVFLESKDGVTRVKILDFGVSKMPKSIGPSTLTEVGQSLGTMSYASPEQIASAKTVDARADVYSVGALAFHALAGRLPFKADGMGAMIHLKATTAAPSLAEVTGFPWPPALESFLAAALARKPEGRYPTARAALEAWRALSQPFAPAPPVAPASGPAASMPLSAPVSTQRSPAPKSERWLVVAVAVMAVVTVIVLGMLVVELTRGGR